MATYSTLINMSDKTLTTLKDEKWFLYGFKAVKGPNNGKPLVWFKTNDFNRKTTITWEEVYEGYIDSAEAITNGKIDGSNSQSIDLGMKLLVAEAGTLTTDRTAKADQIWIKGQSNKRWTCGIAQRTGSDVTPLCAFPLHGLSTVEVMPVEKIVLMFATDQIDTGKVLEQSVGPALLINLTGADKNTRTVAYDTDDTWTANTQGWATILDGTDLVAPLIERF